MLNNYGPGQIGGITYWGYDVFSSQKVVLAGATTIGYTR